MQDALAQSVKADRQTDRSVSLLFPSMRHEFQQVREELVWSNVATKKRAELGILQFTGKVGKLPLEPVKRFIL